MSAMSACYPADNQITAEDAMKRQTLWPRRIAAATIALTAHLLLGAFLLQHWQMETPPAPVVRHLTTTLIALPAAPVETPAAAPQPEPAPEPAPIQTPPPTAAEPPIATPPKPDRTQLARQRQERDAQQTRRRQREEQRRQQQALAQRQAEDEQRRQAALQSQAAARAAESARQTEDMAGRQYQPISKQAPDYPDKALSRKIEGDCTVVYRVNRRGEVEDPQAQSDCNPLFVRPSVNAAKTFRYQPRIINGQPVDVPQVKNTFHYRIE
ncbi:energy transducer TonB [Brenneria populi]|uniref:Protein TonB n=1 Tax=Brenneria populi TaxID=1505588 RepID=A0ABU6JQU2_9GAMM|nr:energy transducer TonB [Brenneria populi Li et al. 2015]